MLENFPANMKVFAKISYYFLMMLHLSALVSCQLQVFHIEVSPAEPINGESATLECLASGYDPSIHSFTWQRSINGTFVSVTANERIAFSPVKLVADNVYSQTVTISHLKESDEGQYLCVVIQASSGDILQNGQGYLHLSDLNEFPVCTPNGPAEVAEGDSLSCRTVIDARTPEVRITGDPSGEREDWEIIRVNETGSELEKDVTSEDDGLTFFCFSILGDIRKALSCKIGPLTVTQDELIPTSPTALLSVGAIAGIAVGGFLLLLLLLIHAICCRCNPKRWLNAKAYLLNFEGIFGTSTPQDDIERGQTELEMDHDNVGRSYAPPQNGFAPTEHPQSHLEDENDPPTLTSEPNVYVDHSVPGPSTEFVPDPNENWHEIDLKRELANALDDEEQSD